RSELVLHDLHAGPVADDRRLLAAGRGLLDGPDPADVEPDRRVELERVAAARGLRAAEHDADLHADLVDEHEQALRPRHGAGELAERLAHETDLNADVAIAHIAL